MTKTSSGELDFNATLELLGNDQQPEISLQTATMGQINVTLFDSLSFDETTEILVGKVTGQTQGTEESAALSSSLRHAESEQTNLLVLIYPDGQCNFLLQNQLDLPTDG